MTPLRFAVLTSLTLITIAAIAQEGDRTLPTQVLLHADSKADVVPTASTITLQLNSKPVPLTALTHVEPAAAQVALLIDDGLSRSAAIQLNDLKTFLKTLPPATEVLVGYMANGSVREASPFTTDHAAAAQAVRLPMGVAGESGSPYFCLSDFVKHWPGRPSEDAPAAPAKARFVLMITNGVDPYNGSTSLANQDSPYVAAAILDAQRAGVAVYSIYYSDAGMRGGGASLSGQSYLQEVAAATGAENYYEGSGNPVSLAPFLKQFTHAIAETYVATFNADAAAGGHDHLVRLKLSTSTPKLKLRHPEAVRPGNREAGL